MVNHNKLCYNISVATSYIGKKGGALSGACSSDIRCHRGKCGIALHLQMARWQTVRQ